MERGNPLVSCIVPVYNGERYLPETLESIFSQSYEHLEVVVVDDGSTDDTAGVAERCPEPVLVVRQPNRGQAAACNAGVEAAAGAFLAFLDADDLWHPEKLSRQMERFETRPGLSFCIAHIENFVSPELAVQGTAHRDIDREYVGYQKGTLLVERQAFETIGGFDISLRHAHDTEWFVRARASEARYEIVPEVLVRRRIHLENHSQVFGARSRAEYLRLVKSVLDSRRLGGSSPGGSP